MNGKSTLTATEKMVCDAIKDAIKSHHPRLKLGAVAAEVGLTYDQILNITNARTKPSPELVDRFRVVLGKGPSWPYAKAPREGARVSLQGTPMAPIRVVGNVAAGFGRFNVDPDDRSVWVPARLADMGGLGWEVEGESMMPYLEPGDVAIFKEHKSPRRHIPFLIKARDESLKVKTLEWQDGQWLMRSLNKAFEDEFLQGHELLGYLIGWYRSKGTRETMDSDPAGLNLI